MIRVSIQVARDLGGESLQELSATEMRRLVQASLAGYAGDGDVTLRLVGKAESRELNRKWRGNGRPTNVLAFPADPATGEIGDIVICLPLARAEAADRRTEPAAHLAHLVVHGCLHLAGLDHDRPRKARAMEALESELLARSGWRDPWAGERA